MLELKNVYLHYCAGTGWKGAATLALDGVSLRLAAGSSLGIVGESGTGKTTLARTVCGLLRPSAGEVLLNGTDIYAAGMSRRQLAGQVQLVWQNAAGSLDPRLSVGRLLSEPLRVNGLSGSAEELLAAVGLPASMASRRPAELSGGEAQRVAIARALAAAPRLLVCDEPAVSLDVRTRLQIVELLARLKAERGLALMLITHDLELAALLAGELAVMYAGRIVERGPTQAILADPLHPYTRLLIDSEPQMDKKAEDFPEADLKPRIDAREKGGGEGCSFYGRCDAESEECGRQAPELAEAVPRRMVACPPAVARSRSGAAAV